MEILLLYIGLPLMGGKALGWLTAVGGLGAVDGPGRVDCLG